MRRVLLPLALIPAIGVVVGCTSGDDTGPSDPTPSEKPSIAASVKPAPAQDNQGRQDVEFDPCLGVGDPVVERAGFSPNTRARLDQIHTGYAFIGCTFKRTEQVRGQRMPVGSLTIFSTNLTLDDFREREGSGASEIKLGGRDAITYRRPAEEACYVVTSGPDGTLDVRVDSSLALTDWKACDHAPEIAEIIVSAVPIAG